MGRRNEHSRAELREIALQAAEHLVAEGGLAALSTRKVAAHIGYTVGSLYLVFHNLDDLIMQMNERTLDALHERLAAARHAQLEPVAAIRALANTYITFALEQSHRWLAIYQHHLPEGQATPPSLNERVSNMFALVQDTLTALCPRRSPAEIALAARALWSGVHGICILGIDQKLEIADGPPVATVAEALLEPYLTGLAGLERTGRLHPCTPPG